MSQLDPTATSAIDICTAALKECNAIGVGQTPLAEDLTDALVRLQWMLQQWERKRWLVYHLNTYSIVATGAQSYTLGPGGQINTAVVRAWTLTALTGIVSGGTGHVLGDVIQLGSGASITVTGVLAGVITAYTLTSGGSFGAASMPLTFKQASTSGVGINAEFSVPTYSQNGTTNTTGVQARPNRIESAFLRQLTQSQPNQIDYQLEPLQSMEDYNRIALKQLVSFPGYYYYDPVWPLGQLFPWPVPQANIYGVFVTAREQLPASFATGATKLTLPFEYYGAILYNLALRLRPKYGQGTYPGDMVPAFAKDGLNVIRTGNAQIGQLVMPTELNRNGLYNIFSDRNY